MAAISPEQPPALQLSAAGATDVGRKRSVNEDSHVVAYPVFLVADGMGGHAAGDLASAAIAAQFQTLAGRGDIDPVDVVDSVLSANDAVRALTDGSDRGAGSTVSGFAVVVQAGTPRWMVFNVGDSRVYRLYDGLLEQLTVDHSAVQELIEQGRLTLEQSMTYSGRNVITRAIGAEDSAADYWLMPIVNGERLLACSDGLTRELNDAAIRAVLIGTATPEQAAQELVRRAVEYGGRDNVTAVVVDVIAGGAYPVDEEPTGSPAIGGWVDTQTIEMPDRVDG
jgi:serine/threonine protein phosphatase PrpC